VSVPTLPYVDAVLRDILNDLTDPGVHVFTKRPADVVQYLPCLVIAPASVSLTTNLRRIDARFGARPMFEVAAFAGDRAVAGQLAAAARHALMTAWLKPYTVPAGSINRVDVLQEPAESTDDALPDGVVRFTGGYAAIIRPARV
jgi:hypothetical protein